MIVFDAAFDGEQSAGARSDQRRLALLNPKKGGTRDVASAASSNRSG